MSDELSEMRVAEITLQLAGMAGAAALRRSAGRPGMLAAVDQHAAQIRDALCGPDGTRELGAHALLEYARGFVAAATGRGWWPGRANGDWETLRLAAVCLLLSRAN